jgi:hypothetical protein
METSLSTDERWLETQHNTTAKSVKLFNSLLYIELSVYDLGVTLFSLSFSRFCTDKWIIWTVRRPCSHVVQELLTLAESPRILRNNIDQSSVFSVMFCRSLLFILSFFYCPLFCLSFFDLQVCIVPLVSSTFFLSTWWKQDLDFYCFLIVWLFVF